MVQANRELGVLRSRIDIITQILNVAEKADRKTRIMYQCNLSFRQLNTYLEFLTDMGLLRTVTPLTDKNRSSLLFETTNKGKDLVKAYNKLRVLLSIKNDVGIPKPSILDCVRC